MAVRAVLLQLLRRRQPDTLAVHNTGGSIIDQSAPDINKLEVPYQLALSASATIDNPPQGQTKYVYGVFLGTDKGLFSMKANSAGPVEYATRNQPTDILMSLDRNIRDLKISQVMASNGLVF